MILFSRSGVVGQLEAALLYRAMKAINLLESLLGRYPVAQRSKSAAMHDNQKSRALFPEPLSILARGKKSLDHFCLHVIAAELVEFSEPEVVAIDI
jgi:hypothetical protein